MSVNKVKELEQRAKITSKHTMNKWNVKVNKKTWVVLHLREKNTNKTSLESSITVIFNEPIVAAFWLLEIKTGAVLSLKTYFFKFDLVDFE